MLRELFSSLTEDAMTVRDGIPFIVSTPTPSLTEEQRAQLIDTDGLKVTGYLALDDEGNIAVNQDEGALCFIPTLCTPEFEAGSVGGLAYRVSYSGSRRHIYPMSIEAVLKAATHGWLFDGLGGASRINRALLRTYAVGDELTVNAVVKQHLIEVLASFGLADSQFGGYSSPTLDLAINRHGEDANIQAGKFFNLFKHFMTVEDINRIVGDNFDCEANNEFAMLGARTIPLTAEIMRRIEEEGL